MCGATSGAGKSTVVAALCRVLARRGVAVSPFKAQNMSNHSGVTDGGGEVGRAQIVQAAAARTPVRVEMNPILLEPSGERTSHVIVLGEERGTTDAPGWGVRTEELRPVVLEAFETLRRDSAFVVAEGAGGAAEINLLDRDLVNLPFAHAAGIPSILVVDIERGGAFAAAHGTVDLLPAHLRDTIGGILFNAFRGDVNLLDPGIRELEARDGIPVLGVLPHLGPERLLGGEDSLDVGVDPATPRSTDPLRVVAVRLPHLANPTDLDPLAVEADVDLVWSTRAADVSSADLVVLPGSRSTVADLAWLRARGIDHALATTSADVIGICAGQQMLGRSIDDGVESGAGCVEGLGLLPLDTRFERPKVVRRRRGHAAGEAVAGYQIHFGRSTIDGDPWLQLDDVHGVEPDGAAVGRIRSTSVHGLFDADRFRRAVLTDLADRHRRAVRPSSTPFADRLDAQHERVADWLSEHADVERLIALGGRAAAPGGGPGW